MRVFYNPTTRPDLPKADLQVLKRYEPGHELYDGLKERAAPNKEALLNSDASGSLLCMDGDTVLSVLVTSQNEYTPMTSEPCIDGGINWSDVYFLSKDLAERFAAECGCRNDGVMYSESSDVYSVHYHHSDNGAQVIKLLEDMGWNSGVRKMSLF